jgi:hypothetical protein
VAFAPEGRGDWSDAPTQTVAQSAREGSPGLQSATRVVRRKKKCFRAQPFRVPKLYLASTMVQQVDAKSLLLLKLYAWGA